jgi:cell division inhibitor SepF
MKIMDKVWGSLGLFEAVEAEEEPKMRVEEMEPIRGKRNNGAVSVNNGGNVVNLQAVPKQMRVIVVEPFSFDDAQHIADHLKNRKPVVVNFENCDKEVAKRMIDFVSGTTYALGGNIQKVGNNIFLCAPNNVDITHSHQEDHEGKEFFPWKNSR